MSKWTAFLLLGKTRIDLFEHSRAVWVEVRGGIPARRLIPRRPETILEDGVLFASALADPKGQGALLLQLLGAEDFRFVDLDLRPPQPPRMDSEFTALAAAGRAASPIQLVLGYFEGSSVAEQHTTPASWAAGLKVLAPVEQAR